MIARNDLGSPRVTCSHERLSLKAILVISGGEICHFHRRFGSVRGGIFLKLNLESTLCIIGKKKKKNGPSIFQLFFYLFIYFYLKGFPILEYYYPIIPYFQLRSICKTAIFFSSFFFFFFLMKVPFLLLKKHK